MTGMENSAPMISTLYARQWKKADISGRITLKCDLVAIHCSRFA